MDIDNQFMDCDAYRNLTTKVRDNCVAWYKNSGDQGSADAMMALSEYAQESSREEEEYNWALRAAQGENIGAINSVCFMRATKNIPTDPVEIESWIKQGQSIEEIDSHMLNALMFLYIGTWPCHVSPSRADELFLYYQGDGDVLLESSIDLKVTMTRTLKHQTA